MLARIALFAPVSRVAARGFQSTPAARVDLVQDLYLKEIKAYKPVPVSAKDSEGNVKPWVKPAAPTAPALEADLAQVAEYESQTVEVAGSSAGETQGSAVEEDWFVIEDVPEEEHH